MFVDGVSNIVADIRTFVGVSERGLGLIFDKVIFERAFLFEPASQEEGEQPNGDCKKNQVKNKLLFVRRTKSPFHVLRVVGIVINENARGNLTDYSQRRNYDEVQDKMCLPVDLVSSVLSEIVSDSHVIHSPGSQWVPAIKQVHSIDTSMDSLVNQSVLEPIINQPVPLEVIMQREYLTPDFVQVLHPQMLLQVQIGYLYAVHFRK